MYEFLLKNIHRVPESVRERWQDDTRYFRPDITTEKYSFVHFHERYRTWEFRCFGNVTNAKDGARCIQLAVEALQYAYKVSLGLAAPSFVTANEWDRSVYQDVIGDAKSVESVAKEKRADRRNRNRQAA